jgi:methyltransferase (TIGR00027 family)
MNRRIETTTSRTAEWMCLTRAASSLETNSYYRSDDFIAPLLLPGFLKPLMHVPLVRAFFGKVMAPKGMYAYVIARTKYIDAAFKKALADQFDQILIFGAGFDTRALRFQAEAGHTRIFELDVPITQQAKIGQYQKRHLAIPSNVVFIAIDFDKESLPGKLDEAGFRQRQRSLFVLEGLLMYLQPESVDATFRTIQRYAGAGSRVVFDHIYESVLRNENIYYGGAGAKQSVSGAGEAWHFGIEKGAIGQFLSAYDLALIDQKDSEALEAAYFSDPRGRIVRRVNGTHCLVTAERK